MKQLPTAEEIAKNWRIHTYESGEPNNDVMLAMIEFAKLHVEAALKNASEKVFAHSVTPVMGGTPIFKRIKIDGKSILNAYPLTNIK